MGTLPYVALQLKAVSSSLIVLLDVSGNAPLASAVPIFGDLALIVALVLAAFAMAFGTRHIDATEHQDGLVLAIATQAIAAEKAALVGEPRVTRQGGKVEIAFTVSGPMDVEIAILGKDDKVVRHLAAGVLGGKNPPPVPLKPGLSQKLEWDGNDNLGQPVQGGPFRARVRAGMSVHSAVSSSGAAWVRVFSMEKRVPKPPR